MSYNVTTQDPYFINYEVIDGLPSSEVYDVEYDNKGYIWFTTDRGVVRYNGYDFKTYTIDDGLKCNTNFEIYKDFNGYLWFTGLNSTLSCWNGKAFINTNFNLAIKQNKVSWIKDLIQINDSIYRFNPNKSRLANNLNSTQVSTYIYNSNSNELIKEQLSLDNLITEFSNYKGENFLFEKETHSSIGSGQIINDSLLVYYIDQNNYSIFNNKKEYYNSISEGKTGSTILNNVTHQNNGLKIPIEFESSINIQLNNTKFELDRINGSIRSSLYNEIQKKTFFLTSIGLKEYDLSNLLREDHSIQSRFVSSKKTYFKNFAFSNGIKDYKGNYWLTTTDKGIIFVPNFNIKLFNTSDLKYPIVNIGAIQSHLILKDIKGNIFKLNSKKDIEKIYVAQNASHKITLDVIDTLKLPDGTKIYSEKEKLIIKETLKETLYGNYNLLLKSGDKIYGVNSIAVRDKNDKYIFGRYCDNENQIHLTKLFQDNYENIWIGSVDGLYLIQNYNYQNIIPYFKKNKIKNTRVSNIEFDITQNGIWVTTHDSGVFHINFETNIINNLNDNNGLKSSLVQNLFQENDSTIWLATNNGLEKVTYIMKGDTMSITNNIHINSHNGLHGNYVFDITKLDDEIWVTHEKGVNYFNVNNLDTTPHPPTIHFDSIIVNNISISTDNNIFKYFENNFNFYYTGVCFDKPAKEMFYGYRLTKDNHSASFNFTNNRNIQFTNLSSGDYTFEVKARNKNEEWSTTPETYNFTIKPHFTETLLFKFVLLLSTLFLFYIFNRSREQKLLDREKQKRLIQETELRAQKAELDALRGQMNPHFVYNAMNSIQNFIFKNEPEKANYYLSKISHLMRNSLEMSKLEFIKLDDEIKFLRTYLELEQMRFKQKIKYEFKIANNVNTEITLPPLILQPIVENCIKHAFKGKQGIGEIEIEFNSISSSYICIIITDNGLGIQHSIKNKPINSHTSLSTKIIEERIQIINTENNNDKAKLIIEDRKLIDNKNGTRVTIYLPSKLIQD